MTHTTIELDDTVEMLAGTLRAEALLEMPAPTPVDEAGQSDEARDAAEELAAHLRRLTRALEAGMVDFETRYSIGQDVLELTAALREYAVRAFLIGGAA